MLLPEWMTEKPQTAPAPATLSRVRSSRYLGRTLRQLKQVVLDQMVTEEYANRPGWWQELDPRVKLLSTLMLVVLAGLTRSWVVLFGIWVITLVIMRFSGLPVLTLQKRIWLFVPLLTLLIAVPAMFNLLPGDPLIYLYHASHPATWWGIKMPEEIYITRQGVKAAFFLTGRVGISLSLGILLITTTCARL